MTRVLSLQTPLLGNRTYGELLRSAFANARDIEFDGHWSDEAHEEREIGFLERQLDRIFLKAIGNPAVRARNLDFLPLRFEIGTSYWARRTLSALLRTREPDVLHLHTQAIAMLSIGIMRRIPTVVSADGSSYQMATQQLHRRWRWTFSGNHVLERRVFRTAAAVITFSQWAADSLIADHGIDGAKIHVIPPGIDLAQFPQRTDREVRPADAAVRILFVGGEFERKGGPALVDAFLSEFANDDRVALHILTKAANVPRHPRIVVHTGVVAYSETWHRMYEDSDLFVMPTKRDQSPIVFLEAMAARLPVVTTPVGSAPEVVIDGLTGYIVPGDDARALRHRMRALVDDPELRRRFGAAGRARVEDAFEASTNARALENVLVAVARPHPMRR